MLNTAKIRDLAHKFEPDIIELRRWLHAHPETAWKEVVTTDKIEEELTKLGIKIKHRGYGGTSCGLIADIEGAKPGRTVMLRADIDALPVTEENDISYKSQNDGSMHACGHECHVAGLIGAARMLMEMKDEINGTVRLLFQPSEEDPNKSGAKTMTEEGALDGVDAAFGIHVASNFPSGMLMYRSGPMMSAADIWSLIIEGKGGHGSSPELVVDPTVAAFQIGNAFNSIVSREVSGRDTAVLSVGSIETSSHVFNVIPERVRMDGTVRTFTVETQDIVQSAMERIADLTGRSCRCRTKLDYRRMIPAVINDSDITDVLVDTAKQIFPPETVRESILIMGSEDFSYFGRKVPSTFVQLGTANSDIPGTDNSHHSSRFNVDESQLCRLSMLHTAFALNFLAK